MRIGMVVSCSLLLAACAAPSEHTMNPEIASRLPNFEHVPLAGVPEVTEDKIQVGSGNIAVSGYVYQDLRKYAFAPPGAVFAMDVTGQISNWAFCRDGTGRRCGTEELVLAIQGCLELAQVAINNGFLDIPQADCKVLALGTTVVWKGHVSINGMIFPNGSDLYGEHKIWLPADPAIEAADRAQDEAEEG